MISNWKNKEANMIKAQEQVEYMNAHFQKETQTTIERSTVYNGPFEEIDWTDIKTHPIPRIQVLNMNTTDAILHIRSVVGDNNEAIKICALNFIIIFVYV